MAHNSLVFLDKETWSLLSSFELSGIEECKGMWVTVGEYWVSVRGLG